MIATIFHELYLVIIIHRDNNLFPREALHSYIDFWFGLAFAIDDVLNVFNFLCLEIWEGLFDLEDFSGVDSWLRCLSIQFSLTFVVQSQFACFEEFGDFFYLFGRFGWDW